VDQILAEENVDNGADETVQWTLTDHLNTVRDIAKYNSGSDMTTVVDHLIYDAFGKVTSETNPAVDSLFLFTARPFDADTGLQNNLNRWYDARVGRWLSEDPIGFAGGDGNLYRYVGNKPGGSTDFAGLEPQCILEVNAAESITPAVHGRLWTQTLVSATYAGSSIITRRNYYYELSGSWNITHTDTSMSIAVWAKAGVYYDETTTTSGPHGVKEIHVTSQPYGKEIYAAAGGSASCQWDARARRCRIKVSHSGGQESRNSRGLLWWGYKYGVAALVISQVQALDQAYFTVGFAAAWGRL